MTDHDYVCRTKRPKANSNAEESSAPLYGKNSGNGRQREAC